MTEEYAQLGAYVRDFVPPPRPSGQAMTGRYARLDKLNAHQHGAGLHAAFACDDRLWDYMPTGPFATPAAYVAWVRSVEDSSDPLFYAITDLETGQLAGVASFLRIAPEAGSIEVGYITFSPALQRRRAATDAMALMMRWAFEAGYRRYEWKCNALNLASRRAAERLGLSYEGVFRQATIVKGRNRDTAWFAAIDQEWPRLRAAFDAWLSPENFDETGRQRVRLSALTQAIRVTDDPALKA
ncbi:MAG: GNAT family protein [Pseudomonadota bacterium]